MFITIYFFQNNVGKPKLCSLNSTLIERPHNLPHFSSYPDFSFFFFMTYPCGYMWFMGLQCLLNKSFIQKDNKYTVMWLMLDELLSMASPLYWQWAHYFWTRYCSISYFPLELSHWKSFNWICRDNGWNSLVSSVFVAVKIGRSSVAFEIGNSFKAEKRLRSSFLNMVALIFFFLWSLFPQRNKAFEMGL